MTIKTATDSVENFKPEVVESIKAQKEQVAAAKKAHEEEKAAEKEAPAIPDHKEPAKVTSEPKGTAEVVA
jgi:hypothetical protein